MLYQKVKSIGVPKVVPYVLTNPSCSLTRLSCRLQTLPCNPTRLSCRLQTLPATRRGFPAGIQTLPAARRGFSAGIQTLPAAYKPFLQVTDPSCKLQTLPAVDKAVLLRVCAVFLPCLITRQDFAWLPARITDICKDIVYLINIFFCL